MYTKCDNCHHECHCKQELHADEYGLCTCDNCECEDDRIQNSDRVKEKSADEEATGEDQD